MRGPNIGPNIAPVICLLLIGCTSLDYQEGADGSVRLSYISTREVTDLEAQKAADGVSVSVGRLSGVEGLADVVADRIMDKIPTTIGVELR